MKFHRFLYSLSVALLVTGVGSVALAQQIPPGTDAAERGRIGPSPTSTVSGPRTSPFEPPKPNDVTFVTDAGPKLDTGCIFRSSGPIVFNIEITRHVGELNPDGTLKDAAALVAAGLLSAKATLIMPAFDVDSTASVPPPFQPEIDRVSFNGEVIGFLSGENNIWKLNTFQIPIEKVKFADRAAIGSSPAPAMNQIRIDIDVGNEPLGEELWCTSIDWGAQIFRAMSPILLIHGNNSNGGFFDRQMFTSFLRSSHLLYDNSITMATDTVAAHGNELNDRIPGIVKSFGVDSVHLIVHSKGGLDSREYLANYQPRHNDEFKVLSLTTLSSPHNGSVGADVLVARANAASMVGVIGSIEFEGFPDYIRQLTALLGTDTGTFNLTTSFVSGFNSTNIPRIASSDTVFNTTAADADTNGNNQIDRTPDEYAELRIENGTLRRLDGNPVTRPVGRYIVDAIYQVLRNTSGVRVTYRTQGICPLCRTIATITSIPNPEPVPNDTLVTIPSGLGVGSLQPFVTNSFSFTGSDGRNHSSIANAGVAARVIPWIINVERTRGDLK